MRRVLNPSLIGVNWGKDIDSDSAAFLDEVMSEFAPISKAMVTSLIMFHSLS